MISAAKGPGNTCIAVCRCDICATETSFSAIHEDAKDGKSRGPLALKSPGTVNKRLLDMEWTLISKRLRCSDCEVARKTPKEKPAMTNNVEPIRQPSREQKRQIIDMLTAAYDVKAERYTGTETDVTIADAIGGGCMFGWVAAIREDMFGPDGGNEEHETLMADLAQWRANADKLANDMHGTLREFNDARAKVGEFQKRLDAVVKASGPKVARA